MSKDTTHVKCANPKCPTPDRLLATYEQYGDIHAPLCHTCWDDARKGPQLALPLDKPAKAPELWEDAT